MEQINKIINGDCIEVLKTFPDNSVDAVITDPPAGISFMNKKWDDKGDLNGFQEFIYQVFNEVYRVMKPGAHALVWALPRTSHHTAMGIERAGLDIRDCVYHVFGSGFPKSLDIGKQIDKHHGMLGYDIVKIKLKLKELYNKSGKNLSQINKECGFNAAGYLRTESRDDDGWGVALPTLEKWNIIKKVINCNDELGNKIGECFKEAEREIIGKSKAGFFEKNEVFELNNEGYGDYDITKSKTKEGSEWEGWGTSLKPAVECWWLVRKPLSEKSVALNVLKWGTGGINIDGCRIEHNEPYKETNRKDTSGYQKFAKNCGSSSGLKPTNIASPNMNGRFPANIIHDGSPEVLEHFPITTSQGHWSKNITTGYGKFGNGKNEYLGVGTKDKIKGSAARFFYCAKASKSERNNGLDDFEEKETPITNQAWKCGICNKYQLSGNGNICKCEEPNWIIPKKTNNHPTVKPIKLMEYLVKLISKENDVVLDCFMGSGTTAIACLKLNRQFIGIEKEPEYIEIAKARIKPYLEQEKLDINKMKTLKETKQGGETVSYEPHELKSDGATPLPVINL